MKKIHYFDLRPIDGRKSFYGKAKVALDTESNIAYLYSYNTIVCSYNINSMVFRRVWCDYSATTMRHINAFRAYYGLHALSKSEWMGLKPFM